MKCASRLHWFWCRHLTEKFTSSSSTVMAMTTDSFCWGFRILIFDFWLIFDLNKSFSKFSWPAFCCFEYYWNQVRRAKILLFLFSEGCRKVVKSQVVDTCPSVVIFRNWPSTELTFHLIHLPIQELYGSSFSITNEKY